MEYGFSPPKGISLISTVKAIIAEALVKNQETEFQSP